MWNYRIVQDKTFELCEVFYSEDGIPYAYANGELGKCESREELIEILEMMLADAKRSPTLTAEEINSNAPLFLEEHSL